MSLNDSYDFFVTQLKGFADGTIEPDWPLLVSHDLMRRKADLPLRDRVYRRWRSILAGLRLAPPYVSPYDWSPALKHVPSNCNTVTIIWAVGIGCKAYQKAACLSLRETVPGFSACSPVLVTDCADFAFFSRLGWLVEYIPHLDGDGDDYFLRKCRYLAWRYRDAMTISLVENVASGMD